MTIGRTHILPLLLALVVFGTGVGTGVAVDRLWLSPSKVHRHGYRHPRSPDEAVERFRERLHLSDEQAEAIREILYDVRAELYEIRDRERPAKEAARQRGQARILELLTSDQAAEYRKMIADEEERRRKRRERRRHDRGASRRGQPD
jgi:hypothetical protein